MSEHVFPIILNRIVEKGLTKREYFAAMAMQALITSLSTSHLSDNRSYYAQEATIMADELIVELNKMQ